MLRLSLVRYIPAYCCDTLILYLTRARPPLISVTPQAHLALVTYFLYGRVCLVPYLMRAWNHLVAVPLNVTLPLVTYDLFHRKCYDEYTTLPRPAG